LFIGQLLLMRLTQRSFDRRFKFSPSRIDFSVKNNIAIEQDRWNRANARRYDLIHFHDLLDINSQFHLPHYVF